MPVTVATVDLERLSRRYTALQMRFAALQGRAAELQATKTRLTREISLAKARIELAPEVTEAFNYLQEQAHMHAVGDFEDLLSAFVDDVVPDAGRIHLELSQERGAPALDIQLDNAGDKESILYGNGGSITNVVVTGLGYSALSRTRNRQLMLLDEPDCWLEAANVPNFVKVIGEVANPRTDADGVYVPGVQTLMISHNKETLTVDGAHIQTLRIERDLNDFALRHGVDVVEVGEKSECAYVVWVSRNGRGKDTIEVRYRSPGEGDDERNALTKGFPYIESIEGARAWVSPDEVGIRWVEVTNLRSHVRTRLNLSSGLNVQTGVNNGGKSNLYFTSLRAMAYGETDDTMIRHGADSATVRLGLENGVVLEMVRSRKGSPKVLYRRFDSQADFLAGKHAHEGRQETRGGVPSFISDVLKIDRVDGLDLQLRSQKEPVFLLNETPARRAQLLSVGRESGLLQAIIERHRLKNRRDKDQLKRDEIELAQVNRTLTAMEPLSLVAGLANIMDGMLVEAQAADSEIQDARALVARLEPLEGRVKLLHAVGDELSAAPIAPVLVLTQSLADVVARVERTHLLAKLPDMPLRPVAPTLADTVSLQRLEAAILRGQQATALLAAIPPAPVAPELSDTARLHRLLATFTVGQQAEVLATLMPTAPAAPHTTDTSDLRRGGVALSKRQEEVGTLEKDVVTVVADATAADEALHALRHEIGVCPTCNQAFPETSHA
jgi:hypothetical protein